MRFSFVAIASAIAATAVMAAPTRLSKRDTASDIGILNYALTLEHLEAAFYKWGLEKFDEEAFKKAHLSKKVRERFVHISEHETTHVNVLTSVIKSLNGTAVPACEYSFPMKNIGEFFAVARALENTGVSAYLGAAAGLNGALLTAAASIVTIEARHSSFLNEIVGQLGAPYAFDTPLDTSEVVTIASNFITKCPYDIGVKTFTQLSATLPEKGSNKVGTKYMGANGKFEAENNGGAATYCQFLYGNNVAVSPRSHCALPKDVIGYFYVVITNTNVPLAGAADDANIIAGPALLFQGDH